MNIFRLFFCLFIISTLFVSFSCNEDSLITQNTPDMASLSKQDRRTIELECGFYESIVWGFNNYQPANGKYLGIWPRYNRFATGRIKELKDKYGFTYIFHENVYSQDNFNKLIECGFKLNNIMVAVGGIPDENRAGIISQYGNVYAYYVGEPADQNHSMGGVRDAINQNHLTSLFVIDGYKRTSSLNNAVNQADKVLFSSYVHWYQLFTGVWVSWPTNNNQRPDWSDMKSRYGSKFTMSWVGAHMDLSEYNVLLGHAQNLNLETVWLYQQLDATDDNSSDNIMSFCSNAWQKGYLRKFSAEMREIYECVFHPKLLSCLCSENNPQCKWELRKRIPTGKTREDLP